MHSPPSLTEVACAPPNPVIGRSVTCTATVTGTAPHPSGLVVFKSDPRDDFSPDSCTLTPIGGNRSRCSVAYTPFPQFSGRHGVGAVYLGDQDNLPSAGHTVVVFEVATRTSVSCPRPASRSAAQPPARPRSSGPPMHRRRRATSSSPATRAGHGHHTSSYDHFGGFVAVTP